MRVLDIDLDFFLDGVAHWRPGEERLDSRDYRPWSAEVAFAFIEDQCGVTNRLPGSVVEHHDEVLARWAQALASQRLRAPFHVTHIDGHADLGLGDAGYAYILTDLLRVPEEERPAVTDQSKVTEGNFLAFAVAYRWLSDISYVFPDGGGDDIPWPLMQDFDSSAANIELKAVDDVNDLFRDPGAVEILSTEPAVPLRRMPFRNFCADEPYNHIYLCRSPGYTPVESDALFDAVRERYVDER